MDTMKSTSWQKCDPNSWLWTYLKMLLECWNTQVFIHQWVLLLVVWSFLLSKYMYLHQCSSNSQRFPYLIPWPGMLFNTWTLSDNNHNYDIAKMSQHSKLLISRMYKYMQWWKRLRALLDLKLHQNSWADSYPLGMILEIITNIMDSLNLMVYDPVNSIQTSSLHFQKIQL